MAITFDFRDVLEINIFCLSFLMTKKMKNKKRKEKRNKSFSSLFLCLRRERTDKVQGCKLHPNLESCSPPFLCFSTPLAPGPCLSSCHCNNGMKAV